MSGWVGGIAPFCAGGKYKSCQMVPGASVIAVRSLRDPFLHLNEVVAAKTIETKDGIYEAPLDTVEHSHLC